MATLIDISRPLRATTAHWPGDRPFTASWTARLDASAGDAATGEAADREEGGGSVVNLGAFAMSTHVGTHADAPLHTRPGGTSIDALALDAFVGPATVIAVAPEADTIAPGAVAAYAEAGTLAPRVLFKTSASAQPLDAFVEAFPPLAPATVRLLAAHGVVLVGTDAPSVDPVDSRTLDAHHALVEAGIVNLENLWLRDVAPGAYTLLALPLALEGLDAAPVRAVLRA
jgi:arylformamidase